MILHKHEQLLFACESESLSVMSLCDPMDYAVHGILLARILEWVSLPFSRGSPQPWDRIQVSGIAGGFFTVWAQGSPLHMVFPFSGVHSPQISKRFSFSLPSGHCSNVILSEKPYITPLYKAVIDLFELPFISCSVFSITFLHIRKFE